MECRVEITETLQRTICVIADSEDEAERCVMAMYRNGDIVLSSSDFVDSEFEVFGEEDADAVL